MKKELSLRLKFKINKKLRNGLAHYEYDRYITFSAALHIAATVRLSKNPIPPILLAC